MMNSELLLIILEDAFFSAIPAIGFAMIFNVPKRFLIYCAIGGAMGHSLRTFAMHFGLQIEWATLLASTSIGLLALYWSRTYLFPRPVVTVAAIIPMIPGKFAFTAMISLMHLHTQGYSAELMQQLIENSLTTLFILLALGFGLSIPSTIIYRGRHIV